MLSHIAVHNEFEKKKTYTTSVYKCNTYSKIFIEEIQNFVATLS